MNDILEKIQQICRVCLLENSLMFSIQHIGCTNQNIHTMIISCTSVKVETDDHLPQLVCSSCLERLETAYLFKEECERSDSNLRNLLSENDLTIDLKYNENVKKASESQANINNSFSDDVHASQIVKVEMTVNEYEEIDIKNEPIESEESENDDDDEDEYVPAKRFRKIKEIKPLKVNKFKIKLLNNNPEAKRVFSCVVCDKNFRHHKRFWLHCKSHPNFTCYVCWKRFKSDELLETHYKEDHSHVNYHCKEEGCDSEFNDCQKYILHKKDDHKIKSFLECMECDKTFEDYEKWDIHIQKHIRTRIYKCPLCPEVFSQKKLLEAHMQFHEATFKCDQCNKSYKSKEKLDRHVKTHSLNTYICEECGKKYNQRYNLKRHIDFAHKGLKPPQRPKSHLCAQCGQTFARPVDLTTHIRLHTGSKPFACDKCEYRCHDKNLLRSHVRIHSGLRPYKCDICQKCFGSRSYLTVHKRFHTGYRPYICTHCTKGFTNSKDLKVHERTHTGIKLYHCETCNNSFTTLHYLKVHSKKHETAQ